jgi:hypothetical protein
MKLPSRVLMRVKYLEIDPLALLDFVPELLVEKVGDRIAGRLNQGNSTADSRASSKRIADAKGNTKVNSGKAQCFSHDATPVSN